MRVAIMQPYFFPYIGYFSLIKHTNQFILFDTVQYIRHGWIDRNRVLKQNNGWLYINVPLINKSRSTIIQELKIDNQQDWKKKIFSQLDTYKKISPYYFQVRELMEKIFEKKYDSLVKFNHDSLIAICHYLNIQPEIKIFSEMNLNIDDANEPDEWALNICKSIGNIDEYWNPIGGQSFFDKSKYIAHGIDLKFQSINITNYDQKRNIFEPGLSIVDVLMFNSVDKVDDMLNKYTLV